MRNLLIAFFVAVIALCVAMAAFMVIGIRAASAQNPDPAPHERFHEYYQHWKQPGMAGLSCCNANEYMEYEGKRTHIFGDCEPTTAHLVNGHWFARVPQYLIDKGADEFVEIPDGKINHEINPSPMEAHLCAIEDWINGKLTVRVLCFVPPFGGG